MGGSDAARFVDQETNWQGLDAAIKRSRARVPDHYRVVHVVGRDKRLHEFPATVIERYAEDLEAAARVCLLKVDEPGNLDFATAAPGGPEVENHDFSLVI